MDVLTPRARLQSLLEPMLIRDPGGRGWLPRVLAAAPHGARLDDVRDDPGYLHPNLTVLGIEGRRPCFVYPVAPPTALSAWFIDHPGALAWPSDAELSPETAILRRALIRDEPPGTRARAQDRARDLMPVRSAFAREWWRFEETYEPDCVLFSDRLVLVLVASDGDGTGGCEPVSPWYPERSRLHQGLETACRLAETQRFGALLIVPDDQIDADADDDAALRQSLAAGAPHLDDLARAELASGYLGTLGWNAAAALLDQR